MWFLPWKNSGKKDKTASPTSKRKGGASSAPSSPRLPAHKSFGVPLDAAPKAPGSKIPQVVEVIVNYLRESALDTEGIFRIPGSVVEVNELIRAFDEGNPINLKQYELHALAGVLKKFFRDLPSPLVLQQLNSQIAALFRNGAHTKEPMEDILARMRAILLQLPTVNFESLKALVSLLVDMHHHTSTNKMTLSNLVTCVVPSLDCSPAIVTYSIQNFDFFFGDPIPQSNREYSLPQPISRRSIVQGSYGPPDASLATSPRHTIALPSPTWVSPPSPRYSPTVQAARKSGTTSIQAAAPRQSLSPAPSTTSYRHSLSPPSSPPRNVSPPKLALSHSAHEFPSPSQGVHNFPPSSPGLLPPPPRSTSSPTRRNFQANRMSMALSTGHSSTPASAQLSLSPRASLSLQISTSYNPRSPSPLSLSPTRESAQSQRIYADSGARDSQGSTRSPSPRAINAYAPDLYAHAHQRASPHAVERPSLSSEWSYPESRPRANSAAPQPTYLFGSDGEEIEAKSTRRRSYQLKVQDPFRYSRSKRGDKEGLVNEAQERERYKERERDRGYRDRDKTKERERFKEAERIRDKERRKEREREREREKEREKEREREKMSTKEREKRWSRRLTLGHRNTEKDHVIKKIEDMRADIQREREKGENAATRTAEVEAKLRQEEGHTNALLYEIDRLKRKIRRSRPKSSVDGGANGAPVSASYDDEFDALPGSSSAPSTPQVGGKVEMKIRMPFP